MAADCQTRASVTINQAIEKIAREIDRVDEQAMFAAVLAMISDGCSEEQMQAVVDHHREFFAAERGSTPRSASTIERLPE